MINTYIYIRTYVYIYVNIYKLAKTAYVQIYFFFQLSFQIHILFIINIKKISIIAWIGITNKMRIYYKYFKINTLICHPTFKIVKNTVIFF